MIFEMKKRSTYIENGLIIIELESTNREREKTGGVRSGGTLVAEV